jgi:hypothetical protein
MLMILLYLVFIIIRVLIKEMLWKRL